MDGSDFFRRFFGIPRDDRSNPFKFPPWEEYDYDEWDELDDVEIPPGNGRSSGNPPGFSFRVFSGDPFDMHRDFEKQMEEVMRNFMGIMGPSQGFPALPSPGGMFEDDSLGQHKSIKPSEDHPRSRYLKPSYENSRPSNSRADSDVDGRISGSEIDRIFDQQPSYQPAVPQVPKTHFFGQSSFSKTIRGPDGRIEHHKTFKSSDGTEQTVVTRQLGDQSHSVTVKKNKDGTTEQLEDFVNMDEGDLSQFNRIWSSRPERGDFPALAPPPPPRDESKSWANKFLKWFK